MKNTELFSFIIVGTLLLSLYFTGCNDGGELDDVNDRDSDNLFPTRETPTSQNLSTDPVADTTSSAVCKNGVSQCADGKLLLCVSELWTEWDDCVFQGLTCAVIQGVAGCYEEPDTEFGSDSVIVPPNKTFVDTGIVPSTDTVVLDTNAQIYIDTADTNSDPQTEIESSDTDTADVIDSTDFPPPPLDTADTATANSEDPCSGMVIISARPSAAIPTVGVIEWSAAAPVTEARIEFGPEGDLSKWVAPVDLTADNYRTLLLGMQENRTYEYQIAATINDTNCISEVQRITTGTLKGDLPAITRQGNSSGGFIVSETFNNEGWNGAFILDETGKYVWSYMPTVPQTDWMRARMSLNGKYMFLANANNVSSADTGVIVRVDMDGANEVSYTLPTRHHDLLALPFDDIIAFAEYEKDGTGICDQIVEMTPDEQKKVVFKIRDYIPARATSADWCHTVALNYVQSEDAYYISVLHQDAIIKFNRSIGKAIWVFGGPDSQFGSMNWVGVHQHHVTENGILFFNNNSGLGSTFSKLLEYEINSESAANLIWDYASGNVSTTGGDVKLLPGDNLQVTYSTQGIIQEISRSERDVLLQLRSTSALGYANRRGSLYDGPPEFTFYPGKK